MVAWANWATTIWGVAISSSYTGGFKAHVSETKGPQGTHHCRHVECHGGGCAARSIADKGQVVGSVSVGFCWVHALRGVGLKCEDIAFNNESMTVRLKSSKTDQYQDGASLVIACTQMSTCPVSMMVFSHGGVGQHV